MSLKVGALFAGYGGIELALASVLDTEPAWFSEFDKAASRILAHHWPDVPNLGDVTKVDWSTVEPVDIIAGGSPCQDLSHAGKRAGMKAGTRSGLWASMCDAIDIIRPRLVVWENVRGALSAEADSAVEPCPLCVGDRPGPTLRALGRVLGDLAELGYDARWYGLRAADVGAAHGRSRVFLFATPGDASSFGVEGFGPGRVGVASALARTRLPDGTDPRAGGGVSLFRTPTAHPDKRKGGGHGPTLADEVEYLLPTPTSADAKASGGYGGNEFCTLTDAVVRKPQRNLSTPTAAVSTGGPPQDSKGKRDLRLDVAQDWREYEAAIRRQETAFGRSAPLPTEPGAKGQPRLSPRFVEWLMGLPEGWVTDVPGISRNDQLKALGNGVVPQQCAAALRTFTHDTREAAA